MAAPCTCPNGQHDGRFPYCSGASGGPIVIERSRTNWAEIIDPRDERIAEMEAQLVTATEKGLELAKLLDPAVVWAARQLKVNADAHPGGCCVKCRAALAEVARLEALILQINDDLGRTWDTGLVDAEALRIRSRL